MNIFVTGATGWVGSAVVAELISAGHKVTGLARSDSSATALTAAGASVHRGELDDLDSLRAGAAACDGVIHTAFTNISDTTDFAASCRADLRAIQAMGEALADSGCPLVTTSGTGFLKRGALATEESPADPAWPIALRVASEHATLALAGLGVRPAIVRLPFSVHGEGDKRGFVADLIRIAREKGFAAYVGDGSNRWPAVHRSDAARLFRLAVEAAPAGSRLHAVGEQGVPFQDIATAIAARLDLPVKAISPQEAQGYFGFLATFAGLDGPVSSAATQELTGWKPTGPGLIADIQAGHYFTFTQL
jgi:nucleoside-diphosphate-sugar epimerase